MKELVIISTFLALLLAVGCRKVTETPLRSDGMVEITFKTPLKVNQTDDMLTRADATPVNLPDNTPIAVKVTLAGATDFSKLLLDVQYVTSTDGNAIPKTEADRLLLPSGKYDLYFILPQTNAVNDDKGIIKVANEVDFMAVKKTITVDVADATAGFQVVDVVFEHLCAAVTVKISAEQYVNSMEIKEFRVTNLPKDMDYDLPTSAMSSATADRLGVVTLLPKDFDVTGVASQTVITQKSPSVVVTEDAIIPRLEVDMTIDGSDRKVIYDFTSSLKSGFIHQVNLTVNAQGTPTKWDITVAPWAAGADVNGGMASEKNVRIGAWLNGGIVFWIDPNDPESYKVLDAGERLGISWNNADAYAVANGKNWRLPTVSELNEIFKLRNGAVGSSVLDKSIAEHFGLPLDDAYWSADNSGGSDAQVCNVATGATTTHPKTDLLRARAVKTVKPAPAIDYSAFPANTYISYPQIADGDMQVIKFSATQKPRSITGKVGHQGYKADADSGTNPSTLYLGGVDGSGKSLTEDLNAGDIKTIEVVWQTMVDHGKGIDNYNGSLDFTGYNAVTAGTAFIRSITYDNTTGLATVTVNGTGNALIAAYNGNEILWSWQIWGTETAPQANVDPSSSANGAGKNFMDRNFGALAAITVKSSPEDAYKYFGTVYQWGRKEPFTGAGPQYTTTLGSDVNAIPTAIFDKDGNWIQSTGETSNTKPQTNTKGGFEYNGSAAPSTYTLLTNPATYYNGGISNEVISGNPNTWTPFSAMGTVKSIYDPCPYGYRVPAFGNWHSFPANSWTINSVDGGTAWQSSWWPAAGGRNYSSAALLNIGKEGNYWSSSRYTTANFAFYLYFTGSNASDSGYYFYRSFGHSVRCVQE